EFRASGQRGWRRAPQVSAGGTRRLSRPLRGLSEQKADALSGLSYGQGSSLSRKAENELSAECGAVSEGLLALVLPETDNGYFYDGLVFAVLDVFNNPGRNPTITGTHPFGE